MSEQKDKENKIIKNINKYIDIRERGRVSEFKDNNITSYAL